MKHLGKTIPPSASSPMRSQSSEKMFYNHCSHAEQFSTCNLSSEKTYAPSPTPIQASDES
jgi:hypothetical protein